MIAARDPVPGYRRITSSSHACFSLNLQSQCLLKFFSALYSVLFWSTRRWIPHSLSRSAYALNHSFSPTTVPHIFPLYETSPCKIMTHYITPKIIIRLEDSSVWTRPKDTVSYVYHTTCDTRFYTNWASNVSGRESVLHWGSNPI